MRTFFIVYAVIFGAFIGISLPLPLLGPLFLSATSPFAFGESERYLFLSLTLAAFPLGNLLGAPLIGFISDRMGRKRMLLATLLGGAIFYALSGFAIAQGNILLLVLSRLLCGLCEGNAAIAQSYIANNATPDNKPRLIGIMIATMSVGYVAGPLVGGLLTDDNLIPGASFALPFYFVACYVMITTLLVVRYFASDNDQAKEVPSGSFVAGLRHLFLNPTFKRLIILTLILAVGRSLYLDFFASFLVLRLGMSSGETTWLWVLTAAIWGTVALFSDFAAKIISYQVKMILACSLAGTFAILSSHSQSILSIGIFSSILVIGLSLASAINALLVSDAAPKSHMGMAMGLLSSTYLCGEVASSLSGGTLLHLSDGTPFIVSGILLLIVASLFFYFLPKKARDSIGLYSND